VKEYVMDIAAKEQARKSSASWKKILKAGVYVRGRQDDVIFRYLAGMDNRVLLALIEGTIAGRAAGKDTKFRHILRVSLMDQSRFY
jgi:hypothetical protein